MISACDVNKPAMCTPATMHLCFALMVLGLASTSIVGCSGRSDRPPRPPVIVSVLAQASTVGAAGTVSISASVENDPRNQGVTWALNGPGS